MKKITTIFVVLLMTLALFNMGNTTAAADVSVVEEHGQLSISNGELVNERGEQVQLKGMSSHGLQWYGQFVNYESMKWLRDDWGITVFRAAMYTSSGGYIEDPSVKEKVKEAIEAAIDLGIYVIIDWHILSDNDPNIHKEEAKDFFDEMSELYGDYPNVIYEIANEPNGSDVTWDNQIKPYAEEVIPVIRNNDPNNIIIVGTGTWSQDVHHAADNQLADPNVMYAFHFYAGTHGQNLRDQVDYALDQGAAVFVSEWGTSAATGDGGVFLDEAQVWIDFMDERNLSWANWSLTHKDESSAALMPGATPTGSWTEAELSPSGTFVREKIREAASMPPSDPTPPSDPEPGEPDPTPPSDPGEYPAWDPNQIYTNEIVYHNDQLWQAKWWTQNQQPGANQYGPWEPLGDAPPSEPSDQLPSEPELDPGEPDPTPPSDPGEYPAWDPNQIYTNEIVYHNGQLWQAKWWTQNQEPGEPYGPWEPLN
ncbi:cellulase family glycosylhydrolase [Salipaludibacillus sp. LMS25]|uniref:cellulase family glycosylhydrolase n=1 Tax=Salipaludibacillus sp. LMS25 TaxID=2924031 RepID=UPI0020D1EAC7|nr:cellulase family glycosylhydrolase [Salipaludibacillus sp. LMS25]UTR16833.1 cellulase family glycosylhydrolase [Salipaludibacillus sp. LMS25]